VYSLSFSFFFLNFRFFSLFFYLFSSFFVFLVFFFGKVLMCLCVYISLREKQRASWMAEMIPSISFIWGGENWMSRNLFIFFKKISRAKNKTFQNNLKKKTKKKKQKRKEHSHQLSISTDTRAVATYYADSIHFWIFFSFFVFFFFFVFLFL